MNGSPPKVWIKTFGCQMNVYDSDRMVDALGEAGGTVAIFVGTLESLNARQRRQGVIDELAGRPTPADTSEFESSPR